MKRTSYELRTNGNCIEITNYESTENRWKDRVSEFLNSEALESYFRENSEFRFWGLARIGFDEFDEVFYSGVEAAKFLEKVIERICEANIGETKSKRAELAGAMNILLKLRRDFPCKIIGELA